MYLKNITFSQNQGVALKTHNVQKILFENVIFDSTNQGFDIDGVSNMTLIGLEIRSNKKVSISNGVNVIMRGGTVKKNETGLHFSKFSSVKVNNVEFSNNRDIAFKLSNVANARLSENNFLENRVGLVSDCVDLLIRDFFAKNSLGVSFRKKSDLGARIIDLSVYQENTKDKEEAA